MSYGVLPTVEVSSHVQPRPECEHGDRKLREEQRNNKGAREKKGGRGGAKARSSWEIDRCTAPGVSIGLVGHGRCSLARLQ